MTGLGKRFLVPALAGVIGLGLASGVLARDSYQSGQRVGGYGYRAPGVDRDPGNRGADYGRYDDAGKHGRRHDWRDDRRGHDRDWRDQRRYDHRYDNRYDNRWHDQRRYDHRGFNHRQPPSWRAPVRYVRPYGYVERRWYSGHRLPSHYYAQTYYVRHDNYRLRPPPYGHRWVRVDTDVLLVALTTGLVVDALHDFFYW